MDFPTIDGETMARRNRRVSFAETTAVHVFDRDDDSLSTPPKSESNVSLSPGSDSGGDESSRDTREDGDDDEEEDDEDGSAVPPVRFVRDMTDFSPSSASAASVASNDDENFFGPLSRSFMGSAGPSDSGMSQDNNNEVHDITLDSTAFSLHYRNIAGDDRSANSAGSLLSTPGVDNKTPVVESGISKLSAANDTVGKFKFSGSLSSAFGDLSFAANNSSNYDFGRMSSTLSDLLRQVDNSMKPNSPVSHPIGALLDRAGDDAMFMIGEVSFPINALMDQNGVGAAPLIGKNVIDVSIDKNGDAAKPFTEQVAHEVAVSVDQNSNSAPVTGEDTHSVDFLIEDGDADKLLTAEVPHAVAISVDRIGDGAEPPAGKDSHPIDASLDKNGGGLRPLTEEVAHPITVSVDQNGDGVKSLTGKDPQPIDVSLENNGDAAKPLLQEVACAVVVSVGQNGDGAEPLTGEDACPIDAPLYTNGSTSRPLTEGVAHPIDISVDQNGDAAEPLTGKDPHPIDVSSDKNGDGARSVTGEVSHPMNASIGENGDCDMPPKEEVSLPVNVSTDQNDDDAKPLAREDLHLVHQLIDEEGNGSKPLTGEFSIPVEVSINQNDDGAKVLQGNGPHTIDVAIDINSDGAQLVTEKVSLPVDVSMVQNSDGVQLVQRENPYQIEENVNCKDLHMLDTHTFDDELTTGKDEDLSENRPGYFQSDNNSCSQVIATSCPQNTASQQVESAIALSSLVAPVQHPESELPMVAPKVAAQALSCAKPYMRNENQEFDLEGRKRKLQQFLASIEDHPAKHAKLLAHENREQGEKHRNYEPDWSKLVEDMSEVTRASSSPFVQKLSIQELGSLSGMIEKFQMARKYERLSAFLRNCDSADQRHQRLAEARSLHDKLLYEKAKLEVNRLKLNKLRSKTELACQGAQECLRLKSRVSDFCDSNSKEAHMECNHCVTNSVSVTQDEQNRLDTKRRALKAIKQDITNVRDSFRVSCKIEEDLSCGDLINIAKEHLKLKHTHSIVQRDLNAWKLHGIVKQGKFEVALDYDFLFQRFTIGTSKLGSISMNTTLNNAKILQDFRHMNAYSAIEFVLKSKFAVCDIDSAKFVRQETLETSLLLGNVIDVLLEVQASKRELLNLISTDFNYKLSNPSTLELQLSFMNFKGGKKVVLSLDLSDLKFGMYPSEPSGLHIEIDPTMTTFDELFIRETKAHIQRLPTGRLMVLRLCRAVSQFVHSYK